MKKLVLIALVAILSNCAPKPDPVWNMTWHCNGNWACANHFNAMNGSGSFSNETDCLLWETAFINSYYGSYVTSCTASN